MLVDNRTHRALQRIQASANHCTTIDAHTGKMQPIISWHHSGKQLEHQTRVGGLDASHIATDPSTRHRLLLAGAKNVELKLIQIYVTWLEKLQACEVTWRCLLFMLFLVETMATAFAQSRCRLLGNLPLHALHGFTVDTSDYLVVRRTTQVPFLAFMLSYVKLTWPNNAWLSLYVRGAAGQGSGPSTYFSIQVLRCWLVNSPGHSFLSLKQCMAPTL